MYKLKINPRDLADFPDNCPTPDGELISLEKFNEIKDILEYKNIPILSKSDLSVETAEQLDNLISSISNDEDLYNDDEVDIIEDNIDNLSESLPASSTIDSPYPLQFGVNKSDSNIIVRSGPSKSYEQIGKLNVLESFCFSSTAAKDSSGYTWYKIYFLSKSGWKSGWYRGYNGVGLWKNNPTFFYDEAPVFRVKKTTKLYNSDMVIMDSEVNPKTGIVYSNFLCYPSSGCKAKTGNTNYLKVAVFFGSDSKNNRLEYYPMTQYKNYNGINYGYVYLNIKESSMNPNLRGNW
jgi:hypothetical protein